MNSAIQFTTDIDAPLGVAWHILTDFASYPSWNPLIRRALGRPRVGHRALLLARPSMHSPALVPLPVRFTAVEPGRHLRWYGALPFGSHLFAGSHYFDLQHAAGRTTLVHGEDFYGSASQPLLQHAGRMLEAAYANFNQAFKARCERGG